jgi:hypothetical protein
MHENLKPHLGEVNPGMNNTGIPAPDSAADALAMVDAGLGYLRDPGAASLLPSELGRTLEAMGVLSSRFAAARAAIMNRFDAERAYTDDGYGSTTAWLRGQTGMTGKAAGAETRRMRQFRDHPVIEEAVARGELPDDWAAYLAEWTRKLPEDLRQDVDRLLVDTAAAGARLEDLAIVARAAFERWRSQQPDPDDPDDGFEDRYLKLGTTFDHAGRLNGDLTPECTAAVQAVLDALGKKDGAQDERTEGQRCHDALQLACELLLRAQLVPDRAGADTHVDAVISLAELLGLPGASELQEAWLAALTREHGYLAGKDAEVAACDAILSPVVTGHPDLPIVDTMIDIVVAFLDGTENQDGTTDGKTENPATSGRAAGRARLLSPEAWQALRYAMARLAVELVSGPDRLAATLRQGLLDAPYNTQSVPLDIGYSASIPGAIRRAVQLRARHCEWPGCDKPPVYCDVHHVRHQADGGETSLSNCALLCQFHHDVCIHRWGWRLVLHPDGTTTAHGPKGQVLHSHGPPGKGPPEDSGPPGSTGPLGSKAA